MELCACLRGTPLPRTDWTSVISLANRTLTTPALKDAFECGSEKAPPDVQSYVAEVSSRNILRNERLATQLADAVTALNGRGITPVLIKGAAFLASRHCARMAANRITSDLDVLVSADERDAALECLRSLGYRTYFQSSVDARKWHADLARPGDVGMIDLQLEPPGHAYFYKAAGEIRKHSTLTDVAGASTYLPSAIYQILLLVVHDQFQDSDYWVGAIDLRHLLDMRELVAASEHFDWRTLTSFTRGQLLRNALETQMVTLFSLLGVEVPKQMRRRVLPQLQYRRRLVQMRLPFLRNVLAALMLLDFRNYRSEVGREERLARNLNPRPWALPKLETIRFLLDLTRDRRLGKV